MKIAIIAERFLLYPDKTIEVGGVQVWLSELIKVLKELGHKVLIIQKASEEFCINFQDIEVKGVGYGNSCGYGNEFVKDCKYNIAAHLFLDKWKADKIIYANSFVTFPIYRHGNIFLQHGIYWDGGKASLKRVPEIIIRNIVQPHAMFYHNDIWLYKKSQLTISVDTNFINYARAILRDGFIASKIVYIPNFSEITQKEKWVEKWKNPDVMTFLFARRFTFYRGTTLWADVVETMLDKTKNTNFIFDGKGAYQDYLYKRFGSNPRVKIRSVDPSDMWNEYLNSHVVVIPTIYSEGTSLACIEGMANGCIPLVTDVGGLANIVIPNYNGYIVRPLYTDLFNASLEIANNLVEYNIELANRAHQIAENSFSSKLWQNRLRNTLQSI